MAARMSELLGVLVVALAAGAWARCAWLFRSRGRATPLPFAPPRDFVAEGPYFGASHADCCERVPRWLSRAPRGARPE
jgi:hypothetical protein